MGLIQKTVYFRTQQDLDAFNAIPNKTEWLHNQLELDRKLNKPVSEIYRDERAPEREPLPPPAEKPKIIKTKAEAERAVQPMFKEPKANKRKSTAGIHYKPTSDWGA